MHVIPPFRYVELPTHMLSRSVIVARTAHLCLVVRPQYTSRSIDVSHLHSKRHPPHPVHCAGQPVHEYCGPENRSLVSALFNTLRHKHIAQRPLSVGRGVRVCSDVKCCGSDYARSGCVCY
eukprot:1055272-Amorphochlora_amoeboformis.AAC.2